MNERNTAYRAPAARRLWRESRCMAHSLRQDLAQPITRAAVLRGRNPRDPIPVT
jgi:hypothetical protein